VNRRFRISLKSVLRFAATIRKRAIVGVRTIVVTAARL
jgi:hypothetical protein